MFSVFKMKILAVETSTQVGSVALAIDGKIRKEFHWTRNTSHGEVTTPFIQNLLKEINLKIEDIDYFSCSVGPGSFTGIRIGLNITKTFCYIFSKKAFLFNTLDTIGFAVESSKPLLIINNAQGGKLFRRRMKQRRGLWEWLSPIEVIEASNLEQEINEQHICLGNGFQSYHHLFSENLKKNLIRTSQHKDYPSAVTLALQASHLDNCPVGQSWEAINAFYIRPSAAEEKLKRGLLKP